MSDSDILEAMTRYGGTFVANLARLYQLADDDNRARLKAAFPEYWAEYTDLAKSRVEQERAR